jgi:hypothetical protein
MKAEELIFEIGEVDRQHLLHPTMEEEEEDNAVVLMDEVEVDQIITAIIIRDLRLMVDDQNMKLSEDARTKFNPVIKSSIG